MVWHCDVQQEHQFFLEIKGGKQFDKVQSKFTEYFRRPIQEQLYPF